MTSFWPLLLVAFAGTVNPSAGDVTLFLPTEQAILTEAVVAPERTRAFAWYNLSGTLAGAVGALAAGVPASSVTNVPRSLASAVSPLLAGWLLDQSQLSQHSRIGCGR